MEKLPLDLCLQGWLNASDASGSNALHDHRDASWSVVYFVDPGAEEPVRNPEGARPGSLLLRTQLTPFTHRYGYLEIVPRAGDMWVFPGHLSHAVLPRSIIHGTSGPLPGSAAAARGGTGRLRVSVAVNCS